MPYREVFNVVLPTFVTIIIGYIFGKFVKLDLSGINKIIFYIGLPAVAFTSILSKDIVLEDAATVWGAELIVTFGCAAAAWLLFKWRREKHSSLYLPAALPNTINIPFPIISLAYGTEGLFYAVLYFIPNSILMNSVAVFIAAGKGWRENLKTVLKVPAMYAAFLALTLNLLHINVPPIVMGPIDFISNMVIPMVVLTLGYSLAQVKITSLSTTLLTALVRLGGGLALGFLAAYLFNITGVMRSVVILVSAMPSAMNTYLLAAMYKNEEELVASVVFVTTAASLVIIPVLLKIL